MVAAALAGGGNVDFLGFMLGGAKVNVPVWKGPVIHVASMCQHLERPTHKFIVMDLEPLVADIAASMPGEIIINLGGIRMGNFGIVLKGDAAVDIWAVMRNVLWEDQHCLYCCGALMRFTEPLHHRVLTRCGPTIAGNVRSDAVEVIDEYWTD